MVQLQAGHMASLLTAVTWRVLHTCPRRLLKVKPLHIPLIWSWRSCVHRISSWPLPWNTWCSGRPCHGIFTAYWCLCVPLGPTICVIMVQGLTSLCIHRHRAWCKPSLDVVLIMCKSSYPWRSCRLGTWHLY